MPEGDWTIIGKYTASSSVVNATLVYKPFNLATPIAGLQSYDWVKKRFSGCLGAARLAFYRGVRGLKFGTSIEERLLIPMSVGIKS